MINMVKYGRLANGSIWGIGEDSYGFWLATGKTALDVIDQIEDGCAQDVYPDLARAVEAASELDA